MEDVFKTGGPAWEDCPEVPGWKMRAESFDYGKFWGVAIWNGKEGADARRHAVRTVPGVENQEDAIEAALPVLKEMAER